MCMMAPCPSLIACALKPQPPRSTCAAFLFVPQRLVRRSMPLPKPPATRAALLSAADYESQSAPKPARRNQKTQTQGDPAPRLLDLRDDRAETAVAKLAPAAK